MTDERCLTELEQVGGLFARRNVRSVFVVADRQAFERSGAKEVLAPLLARCRAAVFDEFEPNPKFEDLQAGMELFEAEAAALNGWDVVLAVGGGTAIDLAKLISALAVQPADPLAIIRREALSDGLPRAGPPLLAVPTTAGTGSEATQFAVIYVEGVKHSVDDPALLPRWCVLDPRLTASLPPRLTAHTGLDALAQAIESLWSVRSTAESAAVAREAVGLILEHLPTAVHAPNPAARKAMCRAAHLAGQAINITRTTAPHAVSYALTSDFGVPHGHAVALLLGPVLLHNAGVTDGDVTDPRGAAHVRGAIRGVLDLLGCETAEAGCRRLQEFVAGLGCETRLRDLGLDGPAAIETIVSKVNLERLGNNPRRLTPAQLSDMLRRLV